MGVNDTLEFRWLAGIGSRIINLLLGKTFTTFQVRAVQLCANQFCPFQIRAFKVRALQI